MMRLTRLMRVGSLIGAAALLLASSSAFGALERHRLPLSSAASFDQFGAAVAMTGSIAVVGAPKGDGKVADSGAAFAYSRLGTTWNQQARLQATDGAVGDGFGYSAATTGDIAVIGAYLDDDRGIDSGSAYIFTRVGSIWSQQAKIVPTDGAAGDLFGYSVAISATTVIIGAKDDDASVLKLNSGSAYVYSRSGTTWSQQTKLTASDAGESDRFGYAIALSGDTAIVGANNDNFDPTPKSGKGSAYIFARTGTSWTEQKKLTANDATMDDHFGSSVALSGDTALIGAKYDDKNTTNTNSGSAYVFTRSGTTWTQQAKLQATDGTQGDFFGHSVAISGNTALIGAFEDKGVDTNSGSAYVFTRLGMSWTQQSKFVQSGAARGDHFGSSVALTNDLAIVGAQFDDDAGLDDRGSAYAFEFVGCSATEQLILTSVDPGTARILAEQLCILHLLPA